MKLKNYLFLAIPLIIVGCATPDYQTTRHTSVLSPDQADSIGGTFLDSNDIRTIASQMTGSLLSTPEIGNADSAVRIAISPIRNSTRHLIDVEILTMRLRAELNKVSQGRVRFFARNVGQDVRREVLTERNRNVWDEDVNKAAEALVNFSQGKGLKTAVIGAVPANLIHEVNAESILGMLRSRITTIDPSSYTFLAREMSGKVLEPLLDEADLRTLDMVAFKENAKFTGADYFLGGQLLSESLSRAMFDPQSQLPSEDLTLNVLLIESSTGETVFEYPIKLAKRITSGNERASYILTGELRALSKASEAGDRSDYTVLSVQLVDPVTNELLWEDLFETKKVSNVGVIYK